MKTKYDTGQEIYVPVTINAAILIGGNVFYTAVVDGEDIGLKLVPEYRLNEPPKIVHSSTVSFNLTFDRLETQLKAI